VTPLLLFGGLASDNESREGAEGDHVVGKERSGADEIHRLNADLKRPKPAPDQGHIVVVLSHDSLLGLSLGDTMVRLCQHRVKRQQALLPPWPN
jgi:hypothetical protein